MRTIKFRAWDKTNKMMIFNDIWIHCYGSKSELPDYHVAETPCEKTYDPRTDLEVMQFTGPTDRNGKEIYEWDIFGKMGGDTERPNEYEVHGYVVFDNDLSAFIVKKTNGGWQYLYDYLKTPHVAHEVIGNIYENPELLK